MALHQICDALWEAEVGIDKMLTDISDVVLKSSGHESGYGIYESAFLEFVQI